MSDQSEKIVQSSDYIKKNFPKQFKPEAALIVDKDFELPKDFKIFSEIDFADIPNFPQEKKNKGKLLFSKTDGGSLIIYQGRPHFYDGVSMRDIGHIVYVLKYLGIKKIISVDEVAHLNPRFQCGDIALIYDHINLMGDNPLIGKNDSELGLRFPDMSNAYDKELHDSVYELIQRKLLKINDSVLLGITGPQSETDAEARFYREIGADVVGYSIVPENITAVHCGVKFIGLGLITRELVADKMIEDSRSEKQKLKDQNDCMKMAEKKVGKILGDIITKV